MNFARYTNAYFLVFLLLIAIVSLFLHLIFLDRIPNGISNDELDNVLNAKAVFLTGHDLSGNWSPWSLKPIASYYEQSELSSTVISPFIGIFPLSLFYARLPYAIFSTLSIIFLMLICQKLFDTKISLVAGIVASINPWFIFIGRSDFDGAIAMMFLLAAAFMLLHFKRIGIILAFIPLFFSFYTYIGAKLVVLPFTLIFVFYSWKYISSKKNTMLYLALAGLVIFVLYVPLFVFQGSRSSEVLLPSHNSVAKRVDYERKQSVVSPLQTIYSNKFTTFTREFEEKYLGAFSVNFLFLHGDPKFLFSLFDHGVFYVFEILFLIVGAVVLFQKKRKEFFLLLCLILISPLPSAFSTVGNSYAIRSFLLFPMLVVLISFGISASLKFFKSKKTQLLFVLGVVVLYGVFLGNFLYIYLARNPVYNSESFNFSSRVLSNYLLRESETGASITVLTGSPQIAYRQYIFYANLYDATFVKQVKDAYKDQTFQYKNISFVSCKDDLNLTEDSVFVLDPGQKCIQPSTSVQNTAITQLSDGGEIYRIINGQTCSKSDLKQYPQSIHFSDFLVEKLSNDNFCNVFISKR